jgi:tripartite-type tricarboxylate transporter receptor subunit TctC
MPSRGFGLTTVPRPARLILGFAAGGSSDLVARPIAEQLRGHYAPSVVVESGTDASGRIRRHHDSVPAPPRAERITTS